jgi:hypothetical protein
MAAKAASLTASAKVGCACDILDMSSAEALNPLKQQLQQLNQHNELNHMNSKNLICFASAIILTKPSKSP